MRASHGTALSLLRGLLGKCHVLQQQAAVGPALIQSAAHLYRDPDVVVETVIRVFPMAASNQAVNRAGARVQKG